MWKRVHDWVYANEWKENEEKKNEYAKNRNINYKQIIGNHKWRHIGVNI